MNRLTAIDWVRPGVEKRARHGSKLSSLRPRAGKYPNAGANTPAKPAKTGPIKIAIVRAGANRASIDRGRL